MSDSNTCKERQMLFSSFVATEMLFSSYVLMMDTYIESCPSVICKSPLAGDSQPSTSCRKYSSHYFRKQRKKGLTNIFPNTAIEIMLLFRKAEINQNCIPR